MAAKDKDKKGITAPKYAPKSRTAATYSRGKAAKEGRLFMGPEPKKTGAAAKSDYVKLKNPAREADRRAFVKAELERKGIKMNPEGRRDVREIAAREMARQKWSKQKKRARRNAPSPSGEYGQSWMSE
jgi:hypothetical protein